MARTFLFASLAASMIAVTGCAGVGQPDGTAPSVTNDEVHSIATDFFVRSPLSGRRVEHLRAELAKAEELGSFQWVRNQGGSRGVQWETHDKRALHDADRTALVQAAFSFQLAPGKKLLKHLEVVAPADDEALGKALDAIGFEASMEDADTAAQRAALVDALRVAAKTRSITIMTASLEYQPDMYWEGGLVVIDEENEQVLFATGGYGT